LEEFWGVGVVREPPYNRGILVSRTVPLSDAEHESYVGHCE